MNRPEEQKEIGQPTVMGRLNETLGYLSTLERHCSDMDGSLFGRGNEGGPKRDVSSTLEGMAAEACERAAMLCGWLGTIKFSLGCSDTVSTTQPQSLVEAAISGRDMAIISGRSGSVKAGR